MIRLTDPDQVEMILRAKIIEQLPISGEYVRNVNYGFGADLDKAELQNVFNSIEHTDTLVLFECELHASSNDLSQTLDDGTILDYRSFRFHVMMYGDNTHIDSMRLSARLRTAKVAQELYAQGVYVYNVSIPVELHDYVNGVIWLRHDFDIDCSAEFLFTQFNDYQSFNQLGDMTIKTI